MASSATSSTRNTSDKSPIYGRCGTLYAIVHQTPLVSHSKAIWSLLAVPDQLDNDQATPNAQVEQKPVGLWVHLTGDLDSGYKVESEWGYSVPKDSVSERYTLHELCRLEKLAFSRIDLWRERNRRRTDPGYNGDPSVQLEIVARFLVRAAQDANVCDLPLFILCSVSDAPLSQFEQATQDWIKALAPKCNGHFFTEVSREELQQKVEGLPKE